MTHGPAPRILIVDNDAIITHLVSTMLQSKGYTIAGIVNTGGEGLLKSAEIVPDLVIMDDNLEAPESSRHHPPVPRQSWQVHCSADVAQG